MGQLQTRQRRFSENSFSSVVMATSAEPQPPIDPTTTTTTTTTTTSTTNPPFPAVDWTSKFQRFRFGNDAAQTANMHVQRSAVPTFSRGPTSKPIQPTPFRNGHVSTTRKLATAPASVSSTSSSSTPVATMKKLSNPPPPTKKVGSSTAAPAPTIPVPTTTESLAQLSTRAINHQIQQSMKWSNVRFANPPAVGTELPTLSPKPGTRESAQQQHPPDRMINNARKQRAIETPVTTATSATLTWTSTSSTTVPTFTAGAVKAKLAPPRTRTRANVDQVVNGLKNLTVTSLYETAQRSPGQGAKQIPTSTTGFLPAHAMTSAVTAQSAPYIREPTDATLVDGGGNGIQQGLNGINLSQWELITSTPTASEGDMGAAAAAAFAESANGTFPWFTRPVGTTGTTQGMNVNPIVAFDTQNQDKEPSSSYPPTSDSQPLPTCDFDANWVMNSATNGSQPTTGFIGGVRKRKKHPGHYAARNATTVAADGIAGGRPGEMSPPRRAKVKNVMKGLEDVTQSLEESVFIDHTFRHQRHDPHYKDSNESTPTGMPTLLSPTSDKSDPGARSSTTLPSDIEVYHQTHSSQLSFAPVPTAGQQHFESFSASASGTYRAIAQAKSQVASVQQRRKNASLGRVRNGAVRSAISTGGDVSWGSEGMVDLANMANMGDAFLPAGYPSTISNEMPPPTMDSLHNVWGITTTGQGLEHAMPGNVAAEYAPELGLGQGTTHGMGREYTFQHAPASSNPSSSSSLYEHGATEIISGLHRGAGDARSMLRDARRSAAVLQAAGAEGIDVSQYMAQSNMAMSIHRRPKAMPTTALPQTHDATAYTAKQGAVAATHHQHVTGEFAAPPPPATRQIDEQSPPEYATAGSAAYYEQNARVEYDLRQSGMGNLDGIPTNQADPVASHQPPPQRRPLPKAHKPAVNTASAAAAGNSQQHQQQAQTSATSGNPPPSTSSSAPNDEGLVPSYRERRRRFLTLKPNAHVCLFCEYDMIFAPDPRRERRRGQKRGEKKSQRNGQVHDDKRQFMQPEPRKQPVASSSSQPGRQYQKQPQQLPPPQQHPMPANNQDVFSDVYTQPQLHGDPASWKLQELPEFEDIAQECEVFANMVQRGSVQDNAASMPPPKFLPSGHERGYEMAVEGVGEGGNPLSYTQSGDSTYGKENYPPAEVSEDDGYQDGTYDAQDPSSPTSPAQQQQVLQQPQQTPTRRAIRAKKAGKKRIKGKRR